MQIFVGINELIFQYYNNDSVSLCLALLVYYTSQSAFDSRQQVHFFRYCSKRLCSDGKLLFHNPASHSGVLLTPPPPNKWKNNIFTATGVNPKILPPDGSKQERCMTFFDSYRFWIYYCFFKI